MNTDSTALRETRFDPKEIQPTEEQRTIQSATDRTIIIEANAGAAKTTTLALRMAESWRRGTSPDNFLALTYTQPACNALRKALQKIGIPYSMLNRFRIQTFEAFCTEILDEIVGSHVPIYENDEQLRPIVWQAVYRVENNESERWRSELTMPSLGNSDMVEEFLKLSTRLKGTMRDVLERGDSSVSPDYAADIGVDYTQLKIFLAFERIRRRENADRPLFRGPLDATYDLARLLYEGESVKNLRTWPFRAKVVVVDEMHDLNQAMFRVLQEVLNTTTSFFCGVGDSDQVLYEMTGAEAGFMGKAIETCTHRTVKRYELTHSYRFGSALATKAGRIAEKPYSSKSSHETKLSLVGYSTEQECTSLVIEAAKAWKAQPRAKMNEFAILLRHSYQSVAIENALLEIDCPYTMSGFDSYLLRPEVLFVRGILAVATDDIGSVEDDQTRQKVMEALFFFSGSKIDVRGREHESQEALLADAIRSVKDAPHFLVHFFDNQVIRTAEPSMQRRLKAAVNIARERSGPNLLNDLLEALNIESIIKESYVSKQRRKDALGNIQGLKLAATRFKTASDYFKSLNAAEKKQSQLKKTDCLLIGSIASVKGLEFQHVVLPYLEQGHFPAPAGSDKEEQNLFYVGMTRSSRFLTMFVSTEKPSYYVQKMGYKPSATSVQE